MQIFFPVYVSVLLLLLVAFAVRLLTRKALVISRLQVYQVFVAMGLIPLLVLGIFFAQSTYKLGKMVNSSTTISLFLWPLFCTVFFVIVLGLILYYGLHRSIGDIALINIDDQMIFDSLSKILTSKGIVYTEKQTRYLLDGGKGSIQVFARKGSNSSYLHFTSAKSYVPVILDELRKEFKDYRARKTPWLSLLVFLPLLPLLSIIAMEIPGLKQLLIIDLRPFGELARVVGGYGARGMYLSGQLMGLVLLGLAVRVWIRKPLIITPAVLRLGAVVLLVHLLSLFMVSVINFDMHLVLFVICLAGVGWALYFLKGSGKYYGFMNILPDQIRDTLTEILNQRNIQFSETRYAIVLQDSTEVKIQSLRQYTTMEISQPENHKDLIKDLLGALGKKPATISVTENLLILVFALLAIAYWFSPYIFRFIFF